MIGSDFELKLSNNERRYGKIINFEWCMQSLILKPRVEAQKPHRITEVAVILHDGNKRGRAL